MKKQGKRNIFALLVCLLFGSFRWYCYAQNAILPRDAGGAQIYHDLERLEIKHYEDLNFFSALKDYDRPLTTAFISSFSYGCLYLTKLDREACEYIYLDNNEWLAGKNPWQRETDTLSRAQRSQRSFYYKKSKKSILKYFYRTPANLLEVNTSDFYLKVNPVIDIRIGNIREEEDVYLIYRRGIEFRAGLEDKFFFYTNLLETQARFPNYVRSYLRQNQAIPGEGFIKSYENDLFGFEDGNDFLNSQSFFGVSLGRDHSFQIKYGRNFIGNGFRSLMLSDFSNNYFHLKFNWNFGKFYYQNIFAEMQAESPGFGGDFLRKKKYLTAHYLGFQASSELNFGIFESTVFNRINQFNAGYLNPLIGYRTIEELASNPNNNILLGFDVKYSFLRRAQVYGQFVLSDLSFRSGDWQNRTGYQIGLKYLDILAVDHLDLQIERNVVRPYTYMNIDSTSNYTHYNQALAHPLGANFKETLFILRYRPFKRLNINTRLILMQVGRDAAGSNWGSDLLRSYRTREQDFGNETGQGNQSDISLFGVEASYQIAHNYFIDLFLTVRNEDSELPQNDLKTSIFGVGFRANLERRNMDF